MEKIVHIILLLVINSFVYAQTTTSVGDNLGNHTATQDLNMNGNYMVNLKTDVTTLADSLLFVNNGTVMTYPTFSFIENYLGDYVTKSTMQTIGGAKTFSVDAVINGLTIGMGSHNISSNTAIGYLALSNNYGQNPFEGSKNTAIGYQSLYSNDLIHSGNVANNNTAVGYNAGYAITGGSNNTIIGSESTTGITTGNYNTILGFNSGTSITTGSWNTIIGANVAGSSSLSNNIILADGAGTVRLQIDAAGVATLTGKLNITSTFTTNKSAGTITINSGTGTVNTTTVTASSIILLTRQGLNGSTVVGELSVGAIIPGISFIINSYKTASLPIEPETGDNSTVGWLIIN